MAVRSTVGDSLANLGNELFNYRSQMQRTRANDLALNEAQRQTGRRAEQELMAILEQAGDYRISPTDTSGALFQYDFGRIAEERPDIAKRVLNADPRFNVAIDERGRKIQTEVDSFVKNDDGSYSVLIKRPDGRRAPITENRTAAGNDVVAKFTAEDFNRIGSNYLGSIVAMGAGENASTFLRDAGQLTDAFLRGATLETAASSQLAEDPAALSQFWAVVNRADSAALEQIASEFGVDVAGLKEKAQQQTQAAPAPAPEPANEQNTPSVRGPTTVRNRQPMTDEEREKSGRRIAGLRARREQRLAQLQDEYDRIKDTNTTNNPRLAARIERKRQELEEYQARVDSMGGAPAVAEPGQQADPQAPTPPATAAEDTSPLPESGVTPPVSLNTRDQVLKALQDQLAEPSDEQIQQMSRYLQSKGVQRASDLRRLPTREAHMAAWLMASRQSGTTKDRVDLANKLLNYVDTGSQEVNRPSLDYQNERLRQFEEQGARQASDSALAWRKWMQSLVDTEASEIDALFDNEGATILAGVVDEDGKYTTPTPEATQALKLLVEETNRMPKGSQKRKARETAIPSFLLTHLRGFTSGRSPGFFDIGDKIDNWFNPDGTPVVGNEANYLRLERDSAGKVTGYRFVHPSGRPEYDFTVSIQALQSQYAPEVMAYLLELGKANEAR